MSENINLNSVFATEQKPHLEQSEKSRQLGITVPLNTLAMNKVNEVWKALEAQGPTAAERVKESTDSNEALMALVKEYVKYDPMELEFLTATDDATIESALKSQASKRSRMRSMLKEAFTQVNYKSLLQAAIAEHLVRLAIGKPTGARGSRARSSKAINSLLPYAELIKLAEDQNELRRQLRNVQSRCSTYKSSLRNAGFSNEEILADERYIEFRAIEDQLKDARDPDFKPEPATASVNNRKYQELRAVLVDLNPDDIKKLQEAKDILWKLVDIVTPPIDVEEILIGDAEAVAQAVEEATAE